MTQRPINGKIICKKGKTHQPYLFFSGRAYQMYLPTKEARGCKIKSFSDWEIIGDIKEIFASATDKLDSEEGDDTIPGSSVAYVWSKLLEPSDDEVKTKV